MDSPFLTIIVVSYNTREMTLECLRSIFRETELNSFEVIVLDNASSDGSASAIEDEFSSRIRLIASGKNLGFAAANNAAALEAQGAFLLLLNPDTVVLDGAVDRLMAFAAARPEAGIWGGRTVFSDGSLNPASCWSRQSLWSLFCQAVGLSSIFRRSSLWNPEGMGGWNREGTRAVDIVSGCFLLIRCDLWRRLGGFRSEFFMYGEEADLCLRAEKLGVKPLISSDSTIVHYGGASEKIRADKLIRLIEAKMRMIEYHFPKGSRHLGCWLLSLWPLTRYWAHAIRGWVIKDFASEKREVWREVIRRREEWDAMRRVKR
jgi:N-acetylglucosaminyl-diphospho-decaprenol L-rhamnosyltransferase